MTSQPGLDPLSSPPSLEGLGEDERIDAMVQWFFENFEDPAQETPYNGREGGYLYIYGGPYEAQDYIFDAFPDATEDEHAEAINRIDAEGPEFAPAGHRIIPPDDEFDHRDALPPLDQRLDLLSYQMDVIGRQVEDILALQRRERDAGGAGIGHNNPPEPMEGQPNLREVLDSIAEVKEELAKADRLSSADPDVITRAEGRFQRFREWLADLVKKSPAMFLLGGVSGAGKMVFDYAVQNHTEIQSTIVSATHTMVSWVSLLTSPF